MTNSAITPKLPTELFDEKTFYTLGGATGAVFLSSWAVSYFLYQFLDCYPVKIIHLIVFILSDIVAFIIMVHKKDTKSIKYFFTFLNGLLIFVNVNGLNQMFYDNNNNKTCPKSSSNTTKLEGLPNIYLKNQNNIYQRATLFRLPGMANWWPDEKLINQNKELITKKQFFKC